MPSCKQICPHEEEEEEEQKFKKNQFRSISPIFTMLQAAPRAARKLFLLLLLFNIFYIFDLFVNFLCFFFRNALFALESSFFASKHALVKVTTLNEQAVLPWSPVNVKRKLPGITGDVGLT